MAVNKQNTLRYHHQKLIMLSGKNIDPGYHNWWPEAQKIFSRCLVNGAIAKQGPGRNL